MVELRPVTPTTLPAGIPPAKWDRALQLAAAGYHLAVFPDWDGWQAAGPASLGLLPVCGLSGDTPMVVTLSTLAKNETDPPSTVFVFVHPDAVAH